MSVTLVFLAGDPEQIAEATREVDYDKLDDPVLVKLRADLSLHIEPRDLNTLSQQFAAFSGNKPVDLRPYLKVGVDEEDRGLLTIEDDWVSYVASVPDGCADAIAQAWASKMREQYSDPDITATAEMKSSVEALITLCKTARKDLIPVVHIWMA
jgi:hypothetical protein